eukprot:scaffold385669_cov41-Prasinocladus_malaysianus.AAC.1
MHVAMLVRWDSPVDLKSWTCGSSLRADARDKLCDPLMPASRKFATYLNAYRVGPQVFIYTHTKCHQVLVHGTTMMSML